MSDSLPQKLRARVRKKALLSFTKLTAPKPVTKQLRCDALTAPGLICGALGYAVGTFLGAALFWIL